MLKLHLVVVGKMKEKFYIEAAEEYLKRLGGYCTLVTSQISEEKLPSSPSSALIDKALDKEGSGILAKIPEGSMVVALCVEGKPLSSEGLSSYVGEVAKGSHRSMTFVIGGSYGLCEKVKRRADLKLSLSAMTLPHHLARVVLLEQVYRSFKILEGSAYHK